MKSTVQVLLVLRRPRYLLPSLFITIIISLIFLYLDEFYFVSPYFVVYVDPSRATLFMLDLTISLLSGIVLVVSSYEIRTFPDLKGSYRKTGMAGVAAAFLAGACPCYYLIPLLATLGGVGGVLGAAGIFLYDYQIPIKLGSLLLLAFTIFTLERGLRAACSLPELALPAKVS